MEPDGQLSVCVRDCVNVVGPPLTPPTVCGAVHDAVCVCVVVPAVQVTGQVAEQVPHPVPVLLQVCVPLGVLPEQVTEQDCVDPGVQVCAVQP